MEPGAVSYQIAKSTAVLQDREDFFSLDRCNIILQNDSTSAQRSCVTSKLVSERQITSNVKRVSTLTFDPSKISKSFIKEEVKDDYHVQNDDSSNVDEDQKLFWCALCDQTFNCHISLEVHMKIHAVKNEHTYSEDYTAHLNNNNISPINYKGGKPYKCSVCDKIFYTRFKLCDHMKIHAGETPFHCPWCEKRFTHGRNFHKHVMLTHKGDDANAASMCAKVLQSHNSFENRLVVYTGEGIKPYKCSVCSKTFRRLYRVKEHTRTHSGQRPFQCSVCSKTFNSSDILYRHIKRIHNRGASLQSAEQKTKATILENDFEKHTTIIQVEGPLDIPVQEIQQAVHDIQFLNTPRHPVGNDAGHNSNHPTYFIDLRADGNNHLEVRHDTANGAFQCSLCGNTFPTSSLLNKHIHTHKIQVSAKCSICSKTFKAESYLRRHMILHSGEKPFKCSLCPKAYYRQYRLSNHWRTHTGERPYQCSVCGKSFTVSDNMYRHIKKMHKGEGLQCASDMVKQIQEMNREKKYYGTSS